MSQTIVFVSCVKTKAPEQRPARSLYTSPLFTFASRYAETLTPHWYILSAKYGVVNPDEVIEPYEKTLNKMLMGERKAWAKDVLDSLADIVSPGDDIIFLAGIPYREGLIPNLMKWGCNISIPMEGLSFGEQLSWLKDKIGSQANINDGVNISRGSIPIAQTKIEQGGSLTQADQIRDHVIQYYIEPARKKGLKTVIVNARDVHGDMGLKNHYPNVCNALDGNKFRDQARVNIKRRSGPKQSSTVVWTFEVVK